MPLRLRNDPDNMMTGAYCYGVATWYSYNNDQENAARLLRQITGNSSWASFGYIAAEADLARQKH